MDAIDAIDAIDKQDQDEYERDLGMSDAQGGQRRANLQPVLYFCHHWILREEAEQPLPGGHGHGHDEGQEDGRLHHEERKDLRDQHVINREMAASLQVGSRASSLRGVKMKWRRSSWIFQKKSG
jgi:hypothetical protein